MKKAFISIQCNTGKVRKERRNGRDVVIVPSYTLKSGIVMNGVRYEHDEIEASYKSLERSPAPLGHPTLNGKFVSASDPEGINVSWVGAWNENVRRDGDRIAIDKVIDVQRANENAGGKALLEAIEKGGPIHSSTGLFCNLEALSDDPEASYTARNMVFDHDCFLLGEAGAATPEQGVGVLVNNAISPDGDEIEVINSAIETDAERDLMWAAESAIRAAEKLEKAPMIERIMDAIKAAVKGPSDPTALTTENDDMDKEKFEELSAKVNALSEGFDKIGETIGTAVANAMKPITDKMAADADAKKAKDEADKAVLVNKVVEAGLLDKETAEAADMAVLNALAEKAKPGKAMGLNGASITNSNDDEWADYDLNSFAKKEA